MYFIVFLVCIQGQPQCTPLVEDPPVYYSTVSECQEAMDRRAQDIVNFFKEEELTGAMEGQCFKDDSVKPT